MIAIDFKIDENQLAEDLEVNINSYEHYFFVSTLFIMPVKFNINGIELFEHNNDPWCEMPIMNVASEGLWSVREAKKLGKKIYSIIEGPGNIKFTMIDQKNIQVFYDYLKTTIQIVVSYNELLTAFLDFANKVRAFIWARVPQLNDRPYWGPWLRGECD